MCQTVLYANLSIVPKYSVKYFWNIQKVGSVSSLLLSPGQVIPVTYNVTVNSTSSVKIFEQIYANVNITNNTGADAVINGVSFSVSPDAVTQNAAGCYLTAGGSGNFYAYPFTLAAGQAVSCDAHIFLSGPGERTVTANVNSVPAVTGVLTRSSADVQGINNGSTDECITVTDSMAGNLGTVCVTDSLPKTFTYTKNIGGYGSCGLYQVNNTAVFTTNDTLTQGSASWIVDVNVPCAGGCSLTPGYWKTHSSYGPASYDDTWAQIGENTTFYLSGQSWYQVLWTAPQGNAYYVLAHAYIAAKLNNLNGADTAVVAADIAFAESFFATHAPSTELTKAERSAVIAAAANLDNYNNGLIGPGHCTE